MSEQPHVDAYPEPVAMTAAHLERVNRMQSEKGRGERLRRLSLRNRDVAWLLAEHRRLASPKAAAKKTSKLP